MALIIVKHSYENEAERFKVECAEKDDSVVLIQNGIFWMLEDLSKYNAKFYAIVDDVVSRGYNPDNFKGIEFINYDKFIELLEKEPINIG